MVRVELAPVLPGTRLAGERPQVAELGSPEHESDTEELKAAPREVTFTVKLPACPCVMVAEAGLTARAKSSPMPDNLGVCGLPEALSIIFT